MTKYLLIALAVLAVTAGMLAMHFRASAAVSAAGRVAAEQRADGLASDLKQSEVARAHEHAEALRFQGIANQFEQDKEHAQADADRTIADLRAGNLRLRAAWRCPASSVQSAATNTGEHQAANRLQEESAGRILRDVAELQAQRDAALDLLEAERRP